MRSFFSPGRLALLVSIAVVGGLSAGLYFLSKPYHSGPTSEPLVVYCAESLRLPMQTIAAAYEKESGQRVEVSADSSQALLTKLRLNKDSNKDGDIYLPADDSYLVMAKEKNLLRETIPLATMSAVVIANPEARPIKTWSDLMSGEIQLILGNPEAAAIGKLTRDALKKSGHWAQVEKRDPTFTPKISDVASGVLNRQRGAGIVFDAVAAQYPTLKVTRLPELDAVKANVALAVTSFSRQPTAALRFARFVAAKDRGLAEFEKHHYRVTENADEYTETPELRLFGGSMLRPAIEDTIREFQEREGIRVLTNWNGCGILVAEMQTKKIPDIYFACEPRFMTKVQEHFGEPEIVSSNRLVIAVAKGNPLGIKVLKDLGREGVRLGIGNENQCALGDLTKITFTRAGLIDRIRRNVAKEAPSGDLLISDFRAKALNVIVCYESNATPYPDEIDFIPIDIGPESGDCTRPLQPVAIAKACKYPQLARRLLDTFQASESRAKFEKLGFGWAKGNPQAAQ